MGYSHMFFALDVEELKKLYGSNNEELLNQILKSQNDDIEENDVFFEDAIEDGTIPNTSTAIMEIIDGNPKMDAEGFIYGYALRIVCQYLGTQIFGGKFGVADVSNHPYKSNLIKLGIPIPIPEPIGFPEIGYLPFDKINDEITLAIANHNKVASVFSEIMLSLFPASRLHRREIDPKAIQEDIDAYVETLEKAKQLGKGVVSFRH